MKTAHKDLKPTMQILTKQGWATVQSGPVSNGDTLLVRLADGRVEMRDPGYLWVRRTNHPLPTKETR